MKLILIIAVCLALLSAGCTEKNDNGSDSGSNSGSDSGSNSGGDSETDRIAAGSGQERVIVNINSPRAGEILQGDEDMSFDSSVEGGEGSMSYEWSSSIDGRLSADQSFNLNPSRLSKGGHVIILKVTDESGRTGQGSVQVEVL